jgi:hypothetical protein
MEQNFSSVWYATPEKVESITKLIVLSDRGSLAISPGEVHYQGRKLTLSIQKIARVSLERQRIPWVSYIIANIALVAYWAILFSGRLNDVIFVGFLAMALLAANLLGLLVGVSTKWILIEYEDESGQTQRAYFAEGSMFGWGGILGGTTRLFNAIEAQRQGHK